MQQELESLVRAYGMDDMNHLIRHPNLTKSQRATLAELKEKWEEQSVYAKQMRKEVHQKYHTENNSRIVKELTEARQDIVGTLTSLKEGEDALVATYGEVEFIGFVRHMLDGLEAVSKAILVCLFTDNMLPVLWEYQAQYSPEGYSEENAYTSTGSEDTGAENAPVPVLG